MPSEAELLQFVLEGLDEVIRLVQSLPLDEAHSLTIVDSLEALAQELEEFLTER